MSLILVDYIQNLTTEKWPYLIIAFGMCFLIKYNIFNVHKSQIYYASHVLQPYIKPYIEISTISHSYKHIYCIIVPLFTILFMNRMKNNSIDIDLLVSFFSAVIFSSLISTIIKILVNKNRPDFLARCRPNKPINATKHVKCTGSIKLIKSGTRSFPSGHSTEAFSGLGFLSIFLSISIKSKNSAIYQFGRSIVIAFPLLIASFIAWSRVLDNRHHIEDIIFGGILGFTGAYVSFNHYMCLKSQ